MSSQKSLTQLAADLTAMFSTGNNVDATDFAAFIANLLKSLNLPLPLPEVVTFIGADNSLENVATVDLAANTLIEIVVSNVVHKFRLITGNQATAGTYRIRPKDYDAETNAKYWQRTDIIIQSFDVGDLTDHNLDITHALGYTYIKGVDVYETAKNTLLARVNSEPSKPSEFTQTAFSENIVRLTFHADLSASHYAIIHL